MRTATTIEASDGGHWREQVDFVVEAEKLGLDICWVAEAWGSDAPSALGYYAARTHRMLLGSAIMQVGTRTPVAVAQSAITLSNLSDGRFLLGLGASGPQVIEGLHGVPFDRPVQRARSARCTPLRPGDQSLEPARRGSGAATTRWCGLARPLLVVGEGTSAPSCPSHNCSPPNGRAMITSACDETTGQWTDFQPAPVLPGGVTLPDSLPARCGPARSC